jgi:hypothetical protein
LGSYTLANQYPSLYNFVQRKQVTVAKGPSTNPINISFRRDLNQFKWDKWGYLLQRLILVNSIMNKIIFVGVEHLQVCFR